MAMRLPLVLAVRLHSNVGFLGEAIFCDLTIYEDGARFGEVAWQQARAPKRGYQKVTKQAETGRQKIRRVNRCVTSSERIM
jgi:hypothetical protein